MRKLLAALWIAIEYIAIGTVLAQLMLLAVLYARGGFTPEKQLKLNALLAGVDLAELRQEVSEEVQPADGGRQEVVVNGVVVLLREDGIKLSETQLSSIRNGLSTERKRYDRLRADFADRLAEEEEIAVRNSRQDLEQAFKVMASKQARRQLIEMYNDPGGLEDVVSIINSMPTNMQKKIFAEFKQPGDEDILQDLLLHLRKGDSGGADAAADEEG